MRAVFGVLSLLIVVAVVAVLARKQLGANAIVPANPGVAMPATAPGATVQQQSQQIQDQVKQSVEAAMQQARPVPDDK